MRLLFLTHRYLGIAISILMLMWCLSGFVMMYVPYPDLPEAARVAALSPLVADSCCAQSAGAAPDSMAVSSVQVEMLAGRVITRLRSGDGVRHQIDLATGRPAPATTLGEARTVAAAFARHTGLPLEPMTISSIQRDQWTVSGEFNPDRPLFRIDFADRGGTELYVSPSSGKALQLTTARTRFWNWLGAIPHWLYFEPLRRHGPAWTQVIIYSALTGCFLTVTGLWIGVRQYLRRPARRRLSPYLGYMLWHHVPGLIFGLFLLSWVASGLLSMNPWGLLEGGDAFAERAALTGPAPSWGEVRTAIGRILEANPGRFVSLRSSPLDGRLYFIGTTAHSLNQGLDQATGQNSRVRLDPTGQAAPLTTAELTDVGALLGGGAPQIMAGEDAFYFDHHSDHITLPVYRLLLPDAEHTRYYLDPVSGEILRKVDSGARGYRWLHQGLHRLDFTSTLRARPLWDAMMILLLTGSAVIAATGLYSAVIRLTGWRRRPAANRVSS